MCTFNTTIAGGVVGAVVVAYGLATIPIRVNARIHGVGNTATVGTMGTLGVIVASGTVVVTKGLATIPVRVNARIHDVGNAAAVGTVGALGVAVASGTVVATEGLATIPVRVNTRIELVGGIRFVGTGSVGGRSTSEVAVSVVVVVTARDHVVVGAGELGFPVVFAALDSAGLIMLRINTGVGCVGSARVRGVLEPRVLGRGVHDLVDNRRHFGGCLREATSDWTMM
jgi:hypothetical protein